MYQIDGLSDIRFKIRLLKLEYLKLYDINYNLIIELVSKTPTKYLLLVQHRYDKRDYFLHKISGVWVGKDRVEILARHYDENIKKYVDRDEVYVIYKNKSVENEMLEKRHFQRRGYLYYVMPIKLLKKTLQ